MSQIVYGILWAATILIATGIAGIWKKYKDDESVQAALEYVRDYADIAVRYAKDVGDNSDLTGSERLKLAVNAIKEVRDKIGVNIDDEQLEQLIRSAYQVMTEEDIIYGE